MTPLRTGMIPPQLPGSPSFLFIMGDDIGWMPPFHTVIGYRALAVDFSENGRFGRNALDFVEHGPVMGVSFRW